MFVLKSHSLETRQLPAWSPKFEPSPEASEADISSALTKLQGRSQSQIVNRETRERICEHRERNIERWP